ncbi:hypothetical protein [Hoeflea olei]|uniref:hypothetical protein n=1 Tax=Hoeflea olei TaxID=1480615 RepID=UPI001496148C|nr:hypothetical protein [Hoeflea olei]
MFGTFAQSLFIATRIAPLSNPEPHRDWRTAARPGDRLTAPPQKDKAAASAR